jgi:hypothetical protein
MNKKTFLFIAIFFFTNNILAQKYFKIEGTKRIFTFYYKNQNCQINDSTSISYYVKGNYFYIKVKKDNISAMPYIKYNILKKKDKTKITSIGRGGERARIRFIDVNHMKAETVSADSKFIEEIIRQ